MLTRSVLIANPTGLHARPASQLVQLAKTFQSRITLRADEKMANAKSILAVLALGAGQGCQVEIEAVGSDEEDAVQQMVAAILSGLGEE